MIRIGLLHSTVRGDEKLLIDAAKRHGVQLLLIDIREQILKYGFLPEKFDVALERSVSTVMGMHAIMFYESNGIPVVNNMAVATICVDKFATSLKLQKNKVPTVPFALTFSEGQTVKAIDSMGGYPVVIKPIVGSWGRLLAKINDQDSLEAVIEQKMVLGTPSHKAFYLQKYIEKPDRDIRVNVIGGNVLCAIYRETKHWITNTARGAQAKPCRVDTELRKICKVASDAVGGGILGIDIFETKTGYLVNEINHTTEFKNVQRTTGVDVAGEIINYCIEKVEKNDKR